MGFHSQCAIPVRLRRSRGADVAPLPRVKRSPKTDHFLCRRNISVKFDPWVAHKAGRTDRPNLFCLRCIPKVMEILCSQEGTAVSSGLSEYFGDSEATISEVVANERASSAISVAEHGAPLLSDVLTPPQVWSLPILPGGMSGEGGGRYSCKPRKHMT